MASLEEIYKELTDAFVSDYIVAEKYGLDTDKTFDEQFSKVCIERVLFYVTAFVMYVREKALDKWLSDVEATALATRYGTKQWWHKMALTWQKGYQIEVDSDGGLDYATEDDEAKIIKYAAIVPDGRNIYIKVAKEESGELQALSSSELTEFSSYLEAIKPLGIRTVGQSLSACGLTVKMKVYYFAQNDVTQVEDNIKTAVEEYIKNITFGGVIFKNKIIDAVQGVDGVSDVEITGITYNDNGTSGDMERTLLSKSGYYKVTSWNITMSAESVGV